MSIIRFHFNALGYCYSKCCRISRWIDQFQANFPFLDPLKTSEKQVFYFSLRVQKVNIELPLIKARDIGRLLFTFKCFFRGF